MKSRYLYFFLLLYSSILSFGFVGDDDPLKNFLEKLARYHRQYRQEKVHIHTDKPYYTIGDTIWFKSYVVNEQKNQLSNLSKILYVELINEKDSIKKSLRLPVVSGLAWGDFILSDSLSEGNYRIRSYTNWMRNFDEAYFFDKTLNIGNSLSNNVVSNVAYSFSKIGIRENVNAAITYKDLDGKPLTGRELSYDIQLDYRNIAKGQSVTDSTGTVYIKFSNSQPFILKSGKISTGLKLDGRTVVSKVFPIKATSDEAAIQFFPESGSLINNIRSVVAFKAIAADGLSRKISGIIIDSDGKKVAAFDSEFAGLGSFAFTPVKGNSYKAVAKFEDGSEKTVDLPLAKDEGLVLTVANTDPEMINLQIAASFQNPDPAEEFILVGQSNGVVHFVSKNKLTSGSFAATLSRNRFPEGIIQFTLFNSSYQPLAERIAFNRRHGQLELNVKADKQDYTPREKVHLALAALDSAGKPVRGSFSISVTNESQIPYDDINETTILSNLLLSSELKGYIERPNYYFTDISQARNKALDNLMLTQGWRKFEWQKVVSERYPVLSFLPEKGINISGKVLNPNGTPVAGGKVSLLTSGGTGMALDTLSDEAGRFSFKDLRFNDSTSFIVQALNAKGKKNVIIEIDRLPKQMVTKNKNAASAEINVNLSVLPYLLSRRDEFDEMRKNGLLRKTIVLQEVKITETKPKVKNSSNLNGAGNADAILVASDLQNCQSLTLCLQGRVPGLVIQNGVAYLTRSMMNSFSGVVPMQLVVDGMYLEPTFLSSISVTDVESIEVLKGIGNTAIYGIRGGGGVLIITTKRGERNLRPGGYIPGIAAFAPQGYYMGRKFYSPNYEAPNISEQPDLRSTIYWNPNLITDAEGNVSVDFFTSDKPGTYKVVTEGLDIQGSLARDVYRFTVR